MTEEERIRLGNHTPITLEMIRKADPKASCCEILRFLRERRGLSKAEVAERLDVMGTHGFKSRFVDRWESGRHGIPADILPGLAKIFMIGQEDLRSIAPMDREGGAREANIRGISSILRANPWIPLDEISDLVHELLREHSPDAK